MIHNKNREKKNKRNIEKLHIRAKRGTDEKKKRKKVRADSKGEVLSSLLLLATVYGREWCGSN